MEKDGDEKDMALFQPTNIFPDLRGSLGNGTISANNDLTVSWQVNGSSALVSWRIQIMQNDTASTVIYDSGTQTAGCPFYGTDSEGNIRFFSATISRSDLTASGVVNGSEYKLIITQNWNGGSVTQSSASAFLTRSAPYISIPNIGAISTRYYTFTANYGQAQGDTLNWFRWQIAYADNTANPFFDSGNISGTMDISCYYDGFFTGTEYAVQCMIQTENGVEATTGWQTFSADYATVASTGTVTAQCVPGTSAVLVDWTGINYTPGNGAGQYSITDGLLTLNNANSSVTWNKVNGEDMSLSPVWGIVYCGTLQNADCTLFTVTQSGGITLALKYDFASRSLALWQGNTVLATQSGIINQPRVTAILTADTLYLRTDGKTGGLYPATALYPATTLYPSADMTNVSDIYTLSVSYTQLEINSVTISGPAVVDYIEVTNGAVSSATITAAINNGEYTPQGGNADYFAATFDDGTINAGNMDVDSQSIIGYALYRRQGESGVLVHIADVDAETYEVYDYGARSQQGPYTYYLFPVGQESYIAAPMVSEEISPCWWDWSLLDCTDSGVKNVFTVQTEFRFGKNLNTSEISNNNRPSILANFTRYPTIQLSPQNYKSGSLTSLIGGIYTLDGQPRYFDSIALREAIMALSVTTDTLFLKSRKGDLWRVRLADAPKMQYGDTTREQTQTMTIPWVEVASADSVSLVSSNSAAYEIEYPSEPDTPPEPPQPPAGYEVMELGVYFEADETISFSLISARKQNDASTTAFPAIVYWGDGTFDTYNGELRTHPNNYYSWRAYPSHSYSPGEYTIKIAKPGNDILNVSALQNSAQSQENITSIDARNGTWGIPKMGGSLSASTATKLITVHVGDNTVEEVNFVDCPVLGTVTFGDNATLYSFAFSNCPAIGPNFELNAKTLRYYAFTDCIGMRNIWIRESVETLGAMTFASDSYDDKLPIDMIYCEADSKPDGWHTDWNKAIDMSYYPVVWGQKTTPWN